MITVVYHSADFDGLFCREIAKKFLPHNKDCDVWDNNPEGIKKPCNCMRFIGWDFQDQPIDMPELGTIVVMDLPLDGVFGFSFKDAAVVWNDPKRSSQPLDRIDWNNFLWIDHHKTSIETHPSEIPGYRIDGVAACRLAWQWFDNEQRHPDDSLHNVLPCKEDFLARRVPEPISVLLAGEYDVWDKRDPNAETFQFGLRCMDLNENRWQGLLGDGDVQFHTVNCILAAGKWAQAYGKKVDADTCKARSFRLTWEGLTFLCINSARFNSNFFEVLDVPATRHDALMGFAWTGQSWLVSLYHAKHRTDLDLSEIAKKFGGGGHRGACGFTCKTLPFVLQ